jgi:hypothetical protein
VIRVHSKPFALTSNVQRTLSKLFRQVWVLIVLSTVSAAGDFAQIDKALNETNDWKATVATLNANTSAESGYEERFFLEHSSNTGEKILLPARVKVSGRVKIRRSLKAPSSIPAGTTLIQDVSFGYKEIRGFDRIAPLSYVLLDQDQNILEVGAPTEAVGEEFKTNLDRKVLSTKEIERLQKLNQDVFEYLKSNARAQKEVKKFAAARNWSKPILEKSGIAYYSEDFSPLEP